MSEDAIEPRPDEEQLLYAKILEIGMYLGLGLLLVTFFLYVSSIVPPAVPVEDLPMYWEMSVHDYLEATNHDHVHQEHAIIGWSWLSVLGKGDYLNFLGIALLSGVTIVCYLGIVPVLIMKRDFVFAAISLAEIVILTLAASGILSVGH